MISQKFASVQMQLDKFSRTPSCNRALPSCNGEQWQMESDWYCLRCIKSCSTEIFHAIPLNDSQSCRAIMNASGCRTLHWHSLNLLECLFAVHPIKMHYIHSRCVRCLGALHHHPHIYSNIYSKTFYLSCTRIPRFQAKPLRRTIW